MTYSAALHYLDSFTNYEKKDAYDYRQSLGLERIRELCALLGDPQDAAPSVHIAGTKGKGSTAAIAQSIFSAAGFRAGLYTSPHLVSFRERIRVGDELVSEEAVARLTGELKRAVCRMAGEKPTVFELYTALAFLYFKEMKADIVVYEVGLGGRLDATNIITPLAAGITPVSYEHMDKLGDTLGRIMYEKAGIVKEGSVVISAPQEHEAAAELRKVCHERRATLHMVGRDITVHEHAVNETRELFSVIGMKGHYRDLEMRLLGEHQLINAAVAIGIAETVSDRGIKISGDAIRSGIAAARWPGRLEAIGTKPYVVLDGAQNRASARALAAAVRRIFKYMRLILVLGVSKDKDIAGILDELLPAADVVILTKADQPDRACDPARIQAVMGEGNGKEPVMTSSVGEALARARAIARPEDLVLVAGSLFVVGEAQQALSSSLRGTRTQ